jgi:hypothetical protein
MRTEARWSDGYEFERMYQHEIDCFFLAKPRDDVDDNQLAAALVLRAEGKLELLKLLHEGKVEVVGPVDFDFDEVNELQFRAV